MKKNTKDPKIALKQVKSTSEAPAYYLNALQLEGWKLCR